jgi:hypothetical protein
MATTQGGCTGLERFRRGRMLAGEAEDVDTDEADGDARVLPWLVSGGDLWTRKERPLGIPCSEGNEGRRERGKEVSASSTTSSPDLW